MLSSRRQEGPDVFGRRLVVEMFGGVPEGVQQGLGLGRRLLLEELDAALHVDRGGTAEGTGRVNPVVEDNQADHDT